MNYENIYHYFYNIFNSPIQPYDFIEHYFIFTN